MQGTSSTPGSIASSDRRPICATHDLPSEPLVVDKFAERHAEYLVEVSDEESKSAKRTRHVWSALGSLGRALCKHSTFSDLHESLRLPPKALARMRDLFPLPLIPLAGVMDRFGIVENIAIDACHYLEVVVVVLKQY